MRRLVTLITIVFGGIVLSCDDSYLFRKPSLISPIEDMVVSYPVFIWHPLDSIYKLEVAKDAQLNVVVIDVENLTDTTYTPSVVLDDGRYFWRVSSSPGDNADWSQWSEAESFIVAKIDIQLIDPKDADTVENPTLVWNSAGYPEYELMVYQGQLKAGKIVIHEYLSDTFFKITDSMYPSTYYWMLKVPGYETEISRFVTYTLDESYYPVGIGYKWKYEWEIDYLGDEQGSEIDTVWSEIEKLIRNGDSLCVYYDGSSIPAIYSHDSVFNSYDSGGPPYKVGKLFPQAGDEIMRYDYEHALVASWKDTTLWFEYLDEWGDDYEFGWTNLVEQRIAGVGLYYYVETYGSVKMSPGSPEESGIYYTRRLLDFTKGN